MRIISGIYKGRQISAPPSLPVRPTTDYAKTGLFNILASRYNFKKLTVADLYAGTGSITYELLSRGCENVVAVDHNPGCIRFINSNLTSLKAAPGIFTVQADAINWLKKTDKTFDVIFADAPFASTPSVELPDIVFSRNLLHKNGLLIIEHISSADLSSLPHYTETRKYGNVSFSFFKEEPLSDIK